MGTMLQQAKHERHLAEWAEMMRQCHCSGLTIRNWCSRNGLSEKAYYYRQKQVCDAMPQVLSETLAKTDERVYGSISLKPSQTVQFVEISSADSSNIAVHIRIGKAEISVDNNSDLALLRNVMRIAAEIC